jgi:acid phosphatase
VTLRSSHGAILDGHAARSSSTTHLAKPGGFAEDTMTRRISTTALIVLGLLGACGGAGSPGTGDDDDRPDAAADPDAPTSTAKPIIFTIVLENKNDTSVVGSPNAPYLNSLIAQGGLATNYKGTIHPSLGNYLNMISGANQYPGVIDLDPEQFPYFPSSAQNLGTQLQAAQIPWRSYQESMGTPCRLTSSGKYAPKHDPFLYFSDIQDGPNGLCAQTNVDYSELAADLASNAYRYMWITPNLDNDGHDPATDPVTGLRNADTWMSHEVPKILASEGFRANGILFVTWDEDEGGNDEKVPMIILSPRLKQAGMTSATPFTHSSYLATIEDLFGLPRLPTVTTTASLTEFLR